MRDGKLMCEHVPRSSASSSPSSVHMSTSKNWKSPCLAIASESSAFSALEGFDQSARKEMTETASLVMAASYSSRSSIGSMANAECVVLECFRGLATIDLRWIPSQPRPPERLAPAKQQLLAPARQQGRARASSDVVGSKS